ncbi:MAG: radical SAM protein [bacterium]|nr:radical SAM protein [bacterium]
MQFVVKTTTACNFHCVYCSEGDKPAQNLPLELFCRFIDELPEFLARRQEKNVDILWHGGEPLLWGRERLEKAMAYAERKLAENYALTFSMQSNGYLLDEDALALLERHRVNVGVSLDGYRELQNANRPTRDGQPTFDRVWQNIMELRRRQLGGSILMVLNIERDIDTDQLFAFIRDNHLCCKINVLIPCGRAANCPCIQGIRRHYVRLLQELYERAVREEDDIIIEPLDKLMDAIILGNGVGECTYNGCCGSDIVCLYSDGALGFCGRDTENQLFSYGSLAEHALEELYTNARAQKVRSRDAYLQQHDCRGCSIWPLCHGGCTFEALQASGDIMAKAPGCEERRELIGYLRTTGLELFRQRLLRKKRQYRAIIAEKKKLLEEVNQLAGK